MPLTAAVAAIQERWATQPRTAIVLGTGLNHLSRQLQAEAVIPYAEIPGFPRSTAIGHTGQLVCGYLGETPVVTMEGRCHLYEGYSWEQVTFPTQVLAALGIEVLILTNASGGLNPRYETGDLMVVEDHLDLLFRQRPNGWEPRRETIYDRELIGQAIAIARRRNFVAHQGVYIAVPGPNYETRAEYRMLRRLGGDVVGMSTVPEALTARQLGLRVFAVSTVTNVARPDAPRTVSALEVIDAAQHAEAKVWALLSELGQRPRN